MKRSLFFLIIAFLSLVALPAVTMAGPDRFLGDSVIYTGQTTNLRPKILFIIDNSKATLVSASGQAYDKNHDYTNDVPSGTTVFPRYAVYKVPQQGISHVSANDLVGPENPANMDYITCTYVQDSVTKYVKDNLLGNDGTLGGSYAGSASAASPNLKKGTGSNAGKTVCDTTGQGATFVLGNFLNWNNVPPPAVLVVGTDGKDYKLKANHTSAADNRPISGANWSTYWQDNGTTGQGAAWVSGVAYNLGTDSQRKIMYDAVTTVVGGARFAANFGAMIYKNDGNKGGEVVYEVSDLTSDANFNAFKAALPGPGEGDGPSELSSQTARPQAEALLDAGYYFRGQDPPIASGTSVMTSPIQYDCENGYVVLLTNGLSNKDNDQALGTIVGDYDNDGRDETQYGLGTHYLDDVAKYLYSTDAMSSLSGTQRVKTHTVLAFQASDSLLERASDGGHGHGTFHNVWNAAELAEALLNIINSILLEVNSSFVAPVVPVSPENKTYSGSRIYMGFFKPQSEGPWLGNLKKFGLDWATVDGKLTPQMEDKNGEVATNDDGSIKSTAKSYWNPSDASDGAEVNKGGVGALLSPGSRNIYTYTGSSTSLTNTSNALTTTNTAITHDGSGGTKSLDVDDATEKNKLINFVRGLDAYDDDGDSSTSDNRSWMLGDILHSKPLVVNYNNYTMANEGTCSGDSANKTMIYVGANDGMLHAVKDCDGSEAWAFIPPDLLPNLKYLRETGHTYFVDGTPVVYTYDANNNGIIESGDKVILLFGERRGGGKDSGTTGGFYYALDVTNPTSPVYLWGASNAASDFSELGETWGTPKISRVKTTSGDMVVAFVGAGYDNLNEDSRYGAIQTFPSSPSVSTGTGTGASSGTSSPSNPKKGLGLYAIKLADLNGTVPTIATSLTKAWGCTNAENSALTFSFPSDVSAQDTDYDGYIDTLYDGDTGGNMWRFNVYNMGTSCTSSTSTKIFASNTSAGDGTTGRKIFYRPSVTFEKDGSEIIFFGTGDREHPLNRGVIDRLYSIKDTGQASAYTEASNLYDATADTLQTTSDVNAEMAVLNSKSGWYIKLDRMAESEKAGEKDVAEPVVIRGVAYFTTHTPSVASGANPCESGNLGTGRVYALNYKTGEAVIDYDTSNNGTDTTNTRAKDASGHTLLRSDRVMTLGYGMPSGVVVMVHSSGIVGGGASIGGGLSTIELNQGDMIIPIYWRGK